MDNIANDINFDKDGQCNYCTEYLERKFLPNPQNSRVSGSLEQLVNKIKDDGKKKSYDCVVGISGGVDSAWVLIKAKELGLRVLCAHMDNGWNSDLAQTNIENLITKTNTDLYTHVIDWVEYRELMQAFFDSDVVDVELLYDNAMFAVNYNVAKKYGIKWILGGTNFATEGLSIPIGWNWFKYDKRNIANIGYLNNVTKFKTFPSIGVLDYVRFEYLLRIKWISFLDYFDYSKDAALTYLKEYCSYRPYPYKHYESIFTRFYQAYILPNKFNIDKRKVHLSSLILSGEISRESAIKLLSYTPYPSETEQHEDIEYFLKKMNWSQTDLDTYLRRPAVEHFKYGSELKLWKILSKIYKTLFLREP